MSDSYDVIIVGAGPGGATAAYFLGQAGKRVLVIEKEMLPRYKACGGLSARIKEVSTMLKDPVCGKRLNRGKAHIVIEYEGVDYFLCCPHCQAEFERSPKTYAKPELGQKAKKTDHHPRRRGEPA